MTREATHRHSYIHDVVQVNDLLIAPHVFEEVLKDAERLVPHESVVFLSARGARPRGTVTVRFAVDGDGVSTREDT